MSAIAVAPHDPALEERSHRLRGLGLILLVTSAAPLLLALEQWLGPRASRGGALEASSVSLVDIADTAPLVALLAYILFRQGRAMRQLGVTARWSDLASGFAMGVVMLLPYAGADLVRKGSVGRWATSAASLDGISMMLVLSLLAFAIRCGLVLCAYVITEVQALTGSAVLAVAASAALQQLSRYSLSAPTAMAVLCGCLFYWKTRRATPVILGIVASGLWVLLHTPHAGS